MGKLFINQTQSSDHSIKNSSSDESFSSLFSIESNKNPFLVGPIIKHIDASTQTELDLNLMDIMLNFIRNNILLFKAFHLSCLFNDFGTNLKNDIEEKFNKFIYYLGYSKSLKKDTRDTFKIDNPELSDVNNCEEPVLKKVIPKIQRSQFFQNFQKQNVLLIDELKSTIHMRNVTMNKNE